MPTVQAVNPGVMQLVSLTSPPYATPHDQPSIQELLKALETDAPGARGLLSLFAFLAAEPLPFVVIRNGRTALPEDLARCLDAEKSANQAVRTLLQRGLATHADKALVPARGVQRAVRAALSEDEQRLWAGAALRFVTQVWPEEPVYDHPIPACDILVGHGLAVTHYAEQLSLDPKTAGALLNQLGLYLHGRGDSTKAERCYYRAIVLGQQAHGEAHEIVGIRWNNLGVVHQALGSNEKAKTCFERSLRILHAVHGGTDETLVQPSRNLYLALAALEDWRATKDACANAMSLFLYNYAYHHPLIAECANVLGGCWRKLGSPKKARTCFEKAILSASNSLEPNPEILASYRTRLGLLLLHEGIPSGAAEEFTAALELYQSVHGKTHRSVAKTMSHLGQAFAAMNRVDDAGKNLEEACRIYEAIEDAKPKDLRNVLNHLQKLLQEADRPEMAVRCLKRMRNLDEEQFGPQSPQLAHTLVKLGKAFYDVDRPRDAQAAFERVLAILAANPEPDPETESLTLHRLGRAHQDQGNLPAAIDCFKKAAAINAALHGEVHALVARDTYYLGCALIEAGDDLVGFGHVGMALRIYEETLGEDHSTTKRVRRKLEGKDA